MRKLVAKWWAKVAPQAYRKAKAIAQPEAAHTDAEETDEADEADASLSDYSSEADASWFAKGVDNVSADVDRHSASELTRIGVKLSKKASIKLEPAIAKMLPTWRRENVDLVRTMFGKEKTKLEQLLADGAGRRFETLARDIEDRFGITTRHAELIARDQTNKLNSRISHTRMRAAGITQAIWTAVADERTRESHMALDGEPFDLDDPPTPEDEDEPALPGEPINCRCVSFPLLPEIDDSSDDDSEEEDSDE